MLLLTKAYNKKIMSNVRAKVQLNAETLRYHPNKRKVMSDAVFVCVNVYWKGSLRITRPNSCLCLPVCTRRAASASLTPPWCRRSHQGTPRPPATWSENTRATSSNDTGAYPLRRDCFIRSFILKASFAAQFCLQLTELSTNYKIHSNTFGLQ